MTIHLKKINSFGTGGGSPTPPIPTEKEYFVKVIDYDGTIIDEVRLDDGEEYTLPQAPTHSGLVFQEWTSSETITNGKITIDKNNVMVGATYTTASGQSEFDIELTTVTGLTVYLIMNGTKDWGDGTIDTNTSHTYSQAGKYTIKCDGNTITATTEYLFNQVTDRCDYVKKVRLNNITSIPDHSFYKCYSLEEITISNSVISIANYCFNNCYSLKGIVIPKGVTAISSYIFSNCYSLLSVVIPKDVTIIDTYAFQSCYSLLNVAIPNSVISLKARCFTMNYNTKYIVIPKNITTIEDYAFSACWNLKKVIVSNGVTKLGKNMFFNCYSLEDITLPNTLKTIDQYCFSYCYSLENIEIPDTVTTINAYAFQYCESLKEIDLPTNLNTLSSYCFQNCVALKEITVPTNIHSIGSYMFDSCRSLEKVTILYTFGVVVNQYAFQNCTFLTKLKINVSNINQHSFENCYSIIEYDFSSCTSVPTLSSTNAFTNINQTCKIKVPASLYNSWITTTGWVTYANYIVAV